jgi:hypothetical protein
MLPFGFPFLEGLSEKWVAASDLKIGDQVLSSSGAVGVVTLVRAYQKPQEMYNLEVARANSFSVGSSGWIVHNADRKIGGTTGKGNNARVDFGKMLPSGVSPSTTHTGKGTNALEDDIANLIETYYPGHVTDVGRKGTHSDGRVNMEMDIETQNALIEVKAGVGGLAGQIADRIDPNLNPTNKPVVGVGAMGKFAHDDVNCAGGIAVTDLFDLLEIIDP